MESRLRRVARYHWPLSRLKTSNTERRPSSVTSTLSNVKLSSRPSGTSTAGVSAIRAAGWGVVTGSCLVVVIAASREMNYTYVGYDIDSLDWVPQTERQDGMFKPAPDLVERILEKKKPGSIIPVRIGTLNGSRNDYLFQHLDLLINGLIDKGYSVVPVSTLIEHAR